MNIRGMRRKLWAMPTVPPRSPNAECPVCGAPVVAAPNGYPGIHLGGSMMAPRTHQELIAACAEHGRLPYNNATLAFDSHAEPLPKRDDNTSPDSESRG